jgi:fructokinase
MGNVKLVILTKGKDGADAYTSSGCVSSVSPAVNAIDTTGAGDGFIGSFLWKLRTSGVGKDNFADCPLPVIKECLDFANCFSAISVQRKGAIPSYPEYKEIK